MKARFPVLFALVLALGAATALAQTQTGAIEGIVKSPDGKTVPGAAVTLSGPSVMGTRTDTTRASGGFRFRNLLPGDDHVVELIHDGFQGQRYEGVAVRVGKTTTLRVDLELATVADVVTITSTLPVIDVTSAVASTSFGADLLENMPAPERGWEDVVLQAPGMVDGRQSGYGRMYSSRGGSVADNQSAFDGVINTYPVTNGLGAGIAFEGIDEVQVLSGALPAEIGNVAGTFINIVTKSGGNELRGEAAIYYKDQDLQSDNVDAGLRAVGLEPTLVTDYQDGSFNLGGPIARDKLWFNVAAGVQDTDRTVTGFPEDEATDNDYAFAKLTWQPASEHSLVAMVNRHDFGVNHFAAAPPLSNYSPEATTALSYENEILKLKWTGILSDSAFLEIDLGVNDQDQGFPAQPEASHAYLDLVTFFYTGGPFIEQFDKTSRDQAKAAFSLFRDDWGGSHHFKFGIEYEDSRYDSFIIKTFSPVFIHYLFLGFPALALFSNSVDGVAAPSGFEGLHAYAQDTWQVSERLTLNLGLRYNTSRGFFPPQSSPGFSYGPFVSFPAVSIEQEIEAFDWSSLEPRLAATIGLDEEGRSVLRLGLSRYHHGPNIASFALGNPNSLALSINPWLDFDGDFFADPNEVFPAIQFIGAAGSPIAPDLEQPYTDEITVAFERQLFGDFSLAVNAFYREAHELIDDVNISAGPSSFLPAEIPDVGADGAPGTADDGTLTVFNQIADFGSLLQISNPDLAERETKGVELVATKRLSNDWQALASLVWQEAVGTLGIDAANAFGFSPGFNDPNSLINAKGPLQLDREWQAKVIATYVAPLGFSFTGNLRYLTGVPIYRSYTVNLFQGPETVVADPKDTHREDDLTQLDLRVEKVFSFGSRPGELGPTLDVFNVFNEDTVTLRQNFVGTHSVLDGSFAPSAGGFRNPREIQEPRTIRIGARLRF